jgi:hypothetical protein
MDQEHASALEAQQQVLASAADLDDALAGNLLRDRRGRLGQREPVVEELGALDAAPGEQRLERDPDRLYFG